MERFKITLKSKLNDLPKTSGVYCFISKLNPKPYALNPIYIGKAINIKARVKNHFNQPSYRDNFFMNGVEKIGYLETNSEIEALILEANLIKKYQPKFNVVWRDDKNYFYVAIAQNKLKIPYIFITHQPKNKLEIINYKFKISYIGPFVEGTALKKTLRFLRKVFPYYTSKKHPKNKCAYCHLDLCPGPELFKNPPSLKASSSAKATKDKSEGLREYRRNIKKLILILQGKRSAVLNSLKQEMSRYARSGVAKKHAVENRDFEEAGKIRDRIYALQQVMAHTHVINYKIEGRPTSQNFGTSDVPITLERIECYDVSNIQGKQATGSIVVFIDGKPDKSQYRKFKIKIENTPNDIAMLKEILERRFLRKEWQYPDAILIDGGKAQLNIAINSKLQNPSYKSNPKIKNIKIMAVAKGRQELFVENIKNPIPLKSLPREVYNLIKNLDDEAHRFAIAYHRKLRKKNLLQ
ncbi:MAG: GIY-YIG nuclease family protein [Patescibacteria group bacterium]